METKNTIQNHGFNSKADQMVLSISYTVNTHGTQITGPHLCNTLSAYTSKFDAKNNFITRFCIRENGTNVLGKNLLT